MSWLKCNWFGFLNILKAALLGRKERGRFIFQAQSNFRLHLFADQIAEVLGLQIDSQTGISFALSVVKHFYFFVPFVALSPVTTVKSLAVFYVRICSVSQQKLHHLWVHVIFYCYLQRSQTHYLVAVVNVRASPEKLFHSINVFLDHVDLKYILASLIIFLVYVIDPQT